ncbi:MAG: nucleotidyltransferase family protein [Euryarchaeota archaeon]|nr:nucleotidyltransferase family protein [Euryarchaeota archaeon]MBU4547474.1 nucleotidyltransferase family protein [Euryarchaeota archaeon]MBV1730322.1 nucleotidyltransferase family protein [Methanobacterium sp.]MBV1755105.1 nucleotidyltransferase family protein [Methanobacterium sp.]MBV1767617.1 nucleotidyltransferase family protein [Methanobacterium sp.]
MKTKSEVLKILETDFQFLRENFHVDKIGLFGSYARQEQSEKSDLDLLINFETTPDFIQLVELEEYLSDLLDIKVEILTSGGIKDRVRPNIMKDMEFVKVKSK